MTDEQIILEELQKRFHLRELEVSENRFNIPPKVVCTALVEGLGGDYKVAFSSDGKFTVFTFPDIADLVLFFEEIQFGTGKDDSAEYNELFNNAINRKWKT